MKLPLLLLLLPLLPLLTHPSSALPRPYVSFVSLPLAEHVEPLLLLAREMASRGYRVSLALPEEQRAWVDTSDGQLEFVSAGPASSHGGSQPPLAAEGAEGGKAGRRRPHAASAAAAASDGGGGGGGVYNAIVDRFRRVYVHYERPMFRRLHQAYSRDRPDLLVVDRYTFAGSVSLCLRRSLTLSVTPLSATLSITHLSHLSIIRSKRPSRSRSSFFPMPIHLPGHSIHIRSSVCPPY